MIEPEKYEATKQAVFLMSPTSLATTEKAQGALIGAVSMLMDVYHLRREDAFNSLLPLIPDNFRIETIPYEWLGMDRPFRKSVLEKVVSFSILWEGLPEEQKRQNINLREDLMIRYINLIPMLAGYAERAESPEVKVYPFTLHGTQWISDFVVTDYAKNYEPGRCNWHGENPSQWAFRGAMVVSDGRLSVHT